MNLAIALFLAYIPFFVWIGFEYKEQRKQLSKSH